MYHVTYSSTVTLVELDQLGYAETEPRTAFKNAFSNECKIKTYSSCQ